MQVFWSVLLFFVQVAGGILIVLYNEYLAASSSVIVKYIKMHKNKMEMKNNISWREMIRSNLKIHIMFKNVIWSIQIDFNLGGLEVHLNAQPDL